MTKPRPPRKTRPTIVDVARRARVSIGTASRVINGYENVDADLKARVNAAIARLDYRPNTSAQDMRRGRTRLVGIVIRDIAVPQMAHFVKSAQDTLYSAGYSVLNASSENNVERELMLIETLSQRRVDGLITAVASEHDARLRKSLRSLGVPVVLLDREEPDSFDAVLVDHRGGTQRAVEHLLDLGHRRIALLTGKADVRPAYERVRGYEAAYKARGLTVDRSLISSESFTEAFAIGKTTALLVAADPATAIIAGGLAILPGMLQAIHTQQRRVPEDVSIISGSDSALAALFTPPITSVRWDYGEVGAAAARLLLERMQQKTDLPPRRVAFPTELVLRGSSAPPPSRRRS
jgi:LacI family transcriptional regulator